MNNWLMRNKGQAQSTGYQPLPGSTITPRASTSPPNNPPKPPERQTSGGFIRKVSPGPEQIKRHLDRPIVTNATRVPPSANRSIAPGQPAPGQRSKEKFVSLPEVDEDIDSQLSIPEAPAALFEDLESPHGTSTRGRIAIYCIAESIDRDGLITALTKKGSRFLLHRYPDVLYGQYSSHAEEPRGDIYYFDYGCVAFWGLTVQQEQEVLRSLVLPYQENPLPSFETERDEFQFHYTANERPHIQNDTITIHHRFSSDHLIKLSISHALSQSTKLCVFEERVLEIVASTKDLPEILASTGNVIISRKAIAQLIGRVFIQKAAVNLLSTVLDTPEFFWSAPDSLQTLYKKVCEYMELDNRVEVLNNRFQVLQEMLDMLRDHKNTAHSARLEWIVIWLIVVEVIVGLFECASILGWVGNEAH
ncbi:hypothetical protein WJX73_007435 [Symbiochloris irregularis]|uniref:DUF155 domain-containing protein n=1 Tax=Symbiochloris irregularis TaxID=706552 RepID=A0AAW1NT96_9CHLO